MSVGEYIAIYAVGVVAVWIFAWSVVAREPTSHGQTILIQTGCAVGFFWPLVLAYFVLGSPFFAWMLWKTRGER